MKNVFIYKEGNEDNVEGENITIAFSDRKSAEKYFQKRVSEHYSVPFEKVQELLENEHPGENITDKNSDSDVYYSSDKILDGDSWWFYYKVPVVDLPKDRYEKIDIGRYQISYNGVSFENGYPYGMVQIFEFENAGSAKPLHGGKAILSFYTELGGPELIKNVDEKFVELLLTNVKENSRDSLYYWYKTWMHVQ